jgi:hypothetical protein
MREVASYVEVVVGIVLEVGIAGRYDPALYGAIIASSTNFGLGGAATTCEDDGADDIKMTTECKLDLELRGVGFCGQL